MTGAIEFIRFNKDDSIECPVKTNTIDKFILNLFPVETRPFVSFGKQDPP